MTKISNRATLGVICIIICSGCGAETGTGQAPPPAVTVTATATTTTTTEPLATTTPTESAPAEMAPTPTSQVGDNSGSEHKSTFIMPDEVGKQLQAAQDDLQAVSGNMFFFSDSKDATGQDRFQVLDSGWQVCSQSPKAGTEVADDASNVIFGVVRVEEPCP